MKPKKIIFALIRGLILITLQFFVFTGIYELGYYLIGRPQIWGVRVTIDLLLWLNLVFFIINAAVSVIIIEKDILRKRFLFWLNILFFIFISIFLFFFLFSSRYMLGIFLIVEMGLFVSCLTPSLVLFIARYPNLE